MYVILFASIMVILLSITKYKMLQNKPALSCLSATHLWVITVLWWCYLQKYAYSRLEPYLCWTPKWKMCTKATAGSLSGWGNAPFKHVQVQTNLFNKQSLVIAVFISYWPGSFAKQGLLYKLLCGPWLPLVRGLSSLLERERHVKAPKRNKES